ncbi:sulfatase [Engelhardtia mirabilis]|uniref:Arylsulfatase n=1 Tax=Engelhardtia mirabilis TaxID=2528011 RepID=A0A518BGE9_9BACT|nr:Arylsulfatase [Planctomycetes bacterium Pla133]QDV00363.1 Arylsulfatase [Planctomycetes bacterium Pla86]
MALANRLALVCAALPIACAGEGGPAPTWTARALQREILLGEPQWAIEANGSAPIEVAMATPSPALRADKHSLPALLLGPGGEVSFGLDVEGASRWRLVGALGADGAAWDQLDAEPELALVLEVLVDGELRAARRLRGGDDRTWRPLADEPAPPVALAASGSSRDRGPLGGLRVDAGAEVRLRCTLEGAAAIDQPPPRGAFARLAWVEERELPEQQASPARPNVVLIVVDTLRADHVGAYGHDRPTTPRIDRLAARGTLFEQTYATSSWTWPSTASIFTGRTSAAHGVTSSLSSYLHGELETLAEALAFGGLRTAAFAGNPLIVPQQNFDQGFETFRHTTAGEMLDADVLVPEAMEWVGAHAGSRFFLYLHLVDPHEPHEWLPRAEQLFPGQKPRGYPPGGMVSLRARALRGASTFDAEGNSRLAAAISPEQLAWALTTYDRAIWTADRWIGDLLDRLGELGLTDSTLVAVTSDHGEEFLDHGALLHGHTLYEEVVRVPLVIAGPGVGSGRRLPEPVSNRDLAATLCDLAGVPFGGDGVDLFAPRSPSPPTFANSAGHWHDRQQIRQVGAREGRWTLIHAINGSAWGAPPLPLDQADPARTALFDVLADPAQTVDLSGEQPEVTAALLDELLRAETADALRVLPTLGSAGADTLAMLRELGYLDADE